MKNKVLVAAWLSLWFLLVYNGCNYITSLRKDVGTCAFDWELSIPFVPILIVPYWSIDFMFVVAPFLCTSAWQLSQHAKRITLGIGVAGICFLCFPLTLVFQRPVVEGILGPLFSSLDNFNNFYNCAPSLHIVLRTCLWAIYGPLLFGWKRQLLAFWYFLIALSTLLCWQHHVIDVITGQLLGLLCLHLFPDQPRVRPTVDRGRSLNARADVALRYGLASLFLFGLTAWGWPSSVLLLWPALALALVAIAYAGAGPGFLGKGDPWSAWLLAPYRWGAALTARFFTSGQAPYAEFAPGLWLGRRLDAHELQALQCPAVLDLTAEYPATPGNHTYLNIPILDLTAPSPEQLAQAVDFLQQHPRCYVHCSLGLGRSVAVAIAYLMSQGQSYEQALQHMTQVRPGFRLIEASRAVLKNLVLKGNQSKFTNPESGRGMRQS